MRYSAIQKIIVKHKQKQLHRAQIKFRPAQHFQQLSNANKNCYICFLLSFREDGATE